MKKFLSFFFLLLAVFFVVSCGDGNSSESTPSDDSEGASDIDSDLSDTVSDGSDSATSDADGSDTAEPEGDTASDDADTEESGKKQGELYGRCYPNKTCNEGLVCDEENDTCIKDPGNQEEPDGSDTGDTASDDDTDTGSGDTDTDTGDTDTDTGDTGSAEVTENHKISGTYQISGNVSGIEAALYECGKTAKIASANTDAKGKFSFTAGISAAKTYCVTANGFSSCFRGMNDHVANVSEITNAVKLADPNCSDLRKSETKVRVYTKLGTGEWLGELDYSKLPGVSEGIKLLSKYLGTADSQSLSAKIAEDAKKEDPEFAKFFNGFSVSADRAETVIGETADSSVLFSVDGGSAKVAQGFKVVWTLKNKKAEAATYKFTATDPGEYVARAKLVYNGNALSDGSASTLFLQRRGGGTVYLNDKSKHISFRIDDGIYGVIPKGTVVTKNGSPVTSIKYTILSAGGSLISRLKFEPAGAKFENDSMYFIHELGTVYGGDPKVLTATRTNSDGSIDILQSATGDPIMLAATGDPIMTTATGDPIMLAATGDPIMMSATGDPIMMNATGDPIMLAATGDPIMMSATGDPIMMNATGDPIMMGTSSSVMVSRTNHYSTFTVEAAMPPVSLETLYDRWCKGSFYQGYSPVKFIREGVSGNKPDGADKERLLSYLTCENGKFTELGTDLYELVNRQTGFQRNLNLFENIFFVSEFYTRMKDKRDGGAKVAVKNGLELRSAIAALYTSTTSYNRSSTLADIYDPSMIPLTYSGVIPEEYSSLAKQALTGIADASDRYIAGKKEMMVFANYITSSSEGPNFSAVTTVLNPDQLVCAWFNNDISPESCSKVYTLNEAGHVALGGTEVSVAEANRVFTEYFMPMNSGLSDTEKLDLFRTLYLALKYAGTIFYGGAEAEELNEKLLKTAYLVFDGIDGNMNAVGIVDDFDASAHTVQVLDGNDMVARPYLAKLSSLTDRISLHAPEGGAEVEKVLVNIEGKEFEKVQETGRTYYKPDGELHEKTIVLAPGTISGITSLKTLLGSENVDELGNITGGMTIIVNSKISGKTYTTRKSYDFLVSESGEGVESRPVPADLKVFVNDKDGEPIPDDANPAIILNPGNMVYYPENGEVRIEGLAPAAYTIDAFADGYLAKSVSVNLPAGSSLFVEARLDEEFVSSADAELEIEVGIDTAKHPSKVYIQIYNEGTELVANETAKFDEETGTYKKVNIEINSGRFTLLAVGDELYNYVENITVYEGSNTKQIKVVAKNACGNGIVDSAEECEPSVEGSVLTVRCGDIYPASIHPEEKAVCDRNTCTFSKLACGKAMLCGDGVIDRNENGSGEMCDGGSRDCSEITGFGSSKGSAPCEPDCSGYRTVGNCSKKTASCGTLPLNAQWNDGTGTFTQTHAGGTNWEPASKEKRYGLTVEECVFSCTKGYKWNGEDECIESPLSLGNICTGQDSCFDNSQATACPAYGSDLFGQDTQYAETRYCTQHSFSETGSGSEKIVKDVFTHYEWRKVASGYPMNWEDASSYCTSSYGGKDALYWRLPTPGELLTIIDSGFASPALDGNKFDAPGHDYWSTEDQAQSGNAWRISGDGALESVDKSDENYVICVHTGEYPAVTNRFTAEDETVKDSESGLMWNKQVIASRTWEEALRHCEDITVSGKFDWRLPNRNELASLVNYEKTGGIKSDMQSLAAKGFWTSTTSLNEPEKAWTVDFADGSIVSAEKTDTKYIICVRNYEPCFGDECPNACGFSPCRQIENSTGVCTASENAFTCGCKSGFNWNHAKCLLDTTKYTACTGLPENAVWNIAFGISQRYDGENWIPSEKGTFNKTKSTEECHFICATNYKWDAENEVCIPESRMVQCSEKKPYSDWNTVSRIAQTWSGEAWEPSSTSKYNEESSEKECRFICKEHYTWNTENNLCDPETQPATCVGLPANAHWWNESAAITQTWTNGGWAPSATGSYNDTAVDNECRFACDTNYEWNDTSCVAKTQTANCVTTTDNSEWTGGYSSITQTWNGSEWFPSETGTYNTEKNPAYCRFKCKENYNWNGANCEPATQIATCTGLPEHATWNKVSSITQTFTNGSWSPSNVGTFGNETVTECHFKCNENYNYDSGTGKCLAGTQTATCVGLPANAQWINSTVTQTWSDSLGWTPAATGHHKSVSTDGCSFDCETDHYRWDSGTSTCVGKTITNQNCTGKPGSAVWNTVSKISQTWSGSAWLPGLAATYNENPAADECRFKCPLNYEWNGSDCIARTQIVSCGTLPANAAWNTVSQIKQTWNGSTEKWEPVVNLVHNDVSSEIECRYKCKENYNPTGSGTQKSCVAATQTVACTGLPANAVWNSSTVVQEWKGTTWEPATTGSHTTGNETDKCYFKCIDEGTKFDWDTTTSTCKGHTKSSGCDNESLPANASWWNANINQTWNGTEWLPTTTGSFSNSAVDNQCRFKCNNHYNWNGATCEAETKISACGTLPSNAQWNTASSIEQHWDESVSGFVPTLTPQYGTEATTAYCRYKCQENYNWNDSECVPATRTRACEGLPANALWRTSASQTGSSFSITQEWNGSEWTPSLTGAHGSYLEGYCRFTCSYEGDRFKWEGSACVPNTKTDQACEGLPENAEWTGGFTKISQTWNTTLNNFEPSNVGTYSTEADSAYCRFQCKEHYIWSAEEGDEGDEGDCVAETRVVDCGEIPANAVWNYAPYITQTWNGNDWTPGLTPEYSISGSENKCRYTCDDGYYYLDGQCVTNPCSSNQCRSTITTFSSGTCNTQPDSFPLSYACVCSNGFYWHGKTGCRSNKPTNFCTGASRCYGYGSEIDCPSEGEAFYGQDAQYAEKGFCAPKSFTVAGTTEQPVINDRNTGLGWQKSTRTVGATWSDAYNYCENLTYGGYSDWRMPTIKEFDTILDLGKRTGADPNYFSNPAGTFWVDNKNETADKLWYIYLQTVKSWPVSYNNNTNYKYDVRCVRGTELTEPTSESFSSDTTGVVKDTDTGLYWSTPGSRVNWKDAFEQCENSTTGGYTDWRLPNINELSSLLNYSKTSGREFSYLPGISSGVEFWSSTNTSAVMALTVNFLTGERSLENKYQGNTIHHYICVRSDLCGEEQFLYGKNCIANRCVLNKPCKNISHSDGSCTPLTASTYRCGCEEGYVWNPGTSSCIEDLCATNNICSSIEGSDGTCTPVSSGILVKCGCVEGYFWDGSRCRPKDVYGNICTSQTTCYNASASMTCPSSSSADFYGQDAQYRLCTAKSFNSKTISGNQVVEDLNTGLMWQKTIPSTTSDGTTTYTSYTFNQAVTYCANLNYGGYTDWRLPKPKELLTTIYNNMYEPATSSTYFPGPSEPYWTSKKDLSTGKVWEISTSDGEFSAAAVTNTTYVRCVRGEPLPDAPSFTTETVNGQKIVTDHVTGLIWQYDQVYGKDWQSALRYCEDLTYAGYDDWRLPNKDELISIFNFDSEYPYTDFPNRTIDNYWSSTTYRASADKAWNVDFYNGRLNFGNTKTNATIYVRCVR